MSSYAKTEAPIEKENGRICMCCREAVPVLGENTNVNLRHGEEAVIKLATRRGKCQNVGR